MDINNIPTKYIKIETLTAIIGKDPSVILSLLEEIIKGSERVFPQMQINLEAQNWASLKNNAHFLKSNFRYMGCTEIATLLKNIETFAMDESKRPQINMLFQEFTLIFPQIINEINAFIHHLKH